MELEYIGELLSDGHLSVDPSVLSKIKKGESLKISIEILSIDSRVESQDKRELDPATKRILERMKNAKPIGAPDDSEELSHYRLMEERMEEKFPSGGGYESEISEALLMIAEQDWKDWEDPEEDIYEEYRQYIEEG